MAPHFWTMIAAVQCETGAAGSALKLLQQAEDRVGQYGGTWQLCEIHRVRAEVMRKLDEFDDEAISAELRKAINLAVDQDAAGWQLRAATALADLLNSKGHRQQALDIMTGVLPDAEKPSRCADVSQAQRLLL